MTKPEVRESIYPRWLILLGLPIGGLGGSLLFIHYPDWLALPISIIVLSYYAVITFYVIKTEWRKRGFWLAAIGVVVAAFIASAIWH